MYISLYVLHICWPLHLSANLPICVNLTLHDDDDDDEEYDEDDEDQEEEEEEMMRRR